MSIEIGLSRLIQNGSSRLLISQVFLPRSVPNRHLQDALITKCFFRASVPNIALSTAVMARPKPRQACSLSLGWKGSMSGYARFAD